MHTGATCQLLEAIPVSELHPKAVKSEFLQVGPRPDFMFCKTFVSDPHGQVALRTAEEGREMLMYYQEAGAWYLSGLQSWDSKARLQKA